jgi:two-component system, chemotaxis family, protein-glutamate methylesterase/glutaminase
MREEVAVNRIIVIGASAGGVEALCGIVRKLPEDWPAAVFVAMHIGPRSNLPEILNRCIGDGVVKFPRDQEQIRPGRIYVAPPVHHLTIHKTHIRLTKAMKGHRYCPSVDLLFQSAARAYGPLVIGVILTGSLSDGAAGLTEIKAKGGVAAVQDPTDAEFPQMPLNAIRASPVDYCLPLVQIPALLKKLVASNQLAHARKLNH